MGYETHTCPVNGCTKKLPYHILMCRLHWSLVRKDLRRYVVVIWNEGHILPDYEARREAAIMYVNARVFPYT